MKTYQFRKFDKAQRYTDVVFETKAKNKKQAKLNFLKSGKDNRNRNYRFVELSAHGEKDIAKLYRGRFEQPIN